MILVSKEELIYLAGLYNLKLLGEIIEYESIVSTGGRSVARGFFRKG